MILTTGSYDSLAFYPNFVINRPDGTPLCSIKEGRVSHRLPPSISRSIAQIGVDEDLSEETERRIGVFTNANEYLLLESKDLRGSVVSFSWEVVSNDIHLYWVTVYDPCKDYRKKRVYKRLVVRSAVLDSRTWRLSNVSTWFDESTAMDDRPMFFRVARREGRIIGLVEARGPSGGSGICYFQHDIGSTSSFHRTYDISPPNSAVIDSKRRIHVFALDRVTPHWSSRSPRYLYYSTTSTNVVVRDVTATLTNHSLPDIMGNPQCTKLILDESERPFLLYGTHYTHESKKYLSFEAVPLVD